MKNKGKKCLIRECNRKAEWKGYCMMHGQRFHKWGDPLVIGTNKGALKGEKNPRWNGGIFQYKNHYEMKKNRKIKLESINYICEVCKTRKATRVHHKDLSKDNHDLNNFIGCCTICHGILHTGRKNKSKFRKIYNYSLRELAEKYNVSLFKILRLLKSDNLLLWLDYKKDNPLNKYFTKKIIKSLKFKEALR